MPGVKRAKTRVLLVDDHPMIRRGLAGLINEDSNLMVCGEAGNSRQALEMVAKVEPNLAIIDLSMEDQNGVQLIKEVRARHPHVLVLVLSMHGEEIYAERALRAGASGYVMKAEAAEKVMDAIRHVIAGKIYISEKINNLLLNRLATRPRYAAGSGSPVERLSERELQIFRLLGDGVGIREIATKLYISIKTVESHRVNIKRKLDLRTSAELLRYAIQYSRIER
jgi:DNA-binding NarL/FixJ family response regulator